MTNTHIKKDLSLLLNFSWRAALLGNQILETRVCFFCCEVVVLAIDTFRLSSDPAGRCACAGRTLIIEEEEAKNMVRRQYLCLVKHSLDDRRSCPRARFMVGKNALQSHLLDRQTAKSVY
jgi:hypothetical protein